MKTVLRINPGFIALAAMVSLLVAGVFLGGFGQTRTNGSIVCLDCIGIFQLGRTGTVIGYVTLSAAALLFVFLVTIIAHRVRERGKA